VHTPAVDRLAAVSRQLREAVQTIRANPFDSDYKEATTFFSSVHGLAGIIGVLAEQPGYRPTDAEGQAVRARMAPLKSKMDEMTKKIESTVNIMAPLPVTATQRLEDRANECGRLLGILNDADSVKDIKEVRDDKTIPDTWKAMFLEELGKSIHETVVEILKTKHEKEMFDAVTKTLDQHSDDAVIGACLWASQTAASAAGNLPGPNSLYVGAVRIKALYALRDLASKVKASPAVLDDVLPHAFDALMLSTEDRTAFAGALNEFRDQNRTMSTSADANEASAAGIKADQVYNEKLTPIVKKGGSPQAGPGLSGVMTVVNLVCLVAVWELAPDLKDFRWQNAADLTLATANAAAGVCTTLLRMRIAVDVMTKLVEHPFVGPALGYFAAVVNIAEGAVAFWNEWHKQDKDYWMLGSDALQCGSGVLILAGVFCASPGLQLLGIVSGICAAAIAIGDDMLSDKMVRFISQLLKQIKEAKSTYDNAPLMISVGVATLVADIEGLVSSCNVTTLAYDRTWTGPGGLVVSKDIVHDRLNALGIDSAQQRQDLLREVWTQ
jgi:hypothetical protein